jgi:glycosyltransferase involved in cell wall biosynthesis
MRETLSIIILTKDEEENLPVTLDSLVALGCRIFVVDSGSADRTRELARYAGCEVVTHPFTSQSEQLNWALENLPIDTPWVMRLDADERATPELVEELRSTLPAAPPGVTGFELKRRVYFWGSWIRHGGYYPTWLFRIWRRGTARSEQRWMDEHMVSSGGARAKLRHDIIDENQKGLGFWIDKHNRYADREVKDMLAMKSERERVQVEGQAGQRRWLKQNVYSRAPMFVRAFAYWFFRYFLKLGFLDGLAGLVFHFNQALWYRLLVDAKMHERLLREQGRGAWAKGADEERRAGGQR